MKYPDMDIDLRSPLPDIVWSLLRCPQCGSGLERSSRQMHCSGCGTVFENRDKGLLDLRLKRVKKVRMEFPLGSPGPGESMSFGTLPRCSAPEVDSPGSGAKWHLSEELRSYIPIAKRPGAVALDLGCGSGLHREVCEHAGFQWVGLDYGNPGAPILGDAHALPLADASVDCVISLAVLEHLRFPFVAASEVHRVLRPGGTYLGTVAFLEPFHGDSYYHHTHFGTFNTLATAGFDVRHVAPQAHWSGLRAQAVMSLFPRMPNWAKLASVWPIEVASKLWWRAGALAGAGASETARLCGTTGGFEFVARKPE